MSSMEVGILQGETIHVLIECILHQCELDFVDLLSASLLKGTIFVHEIVRIFAIQLVESENMDDHLGRHNWRFEIVYRFNYIHNEISLMLSAKFSLLMSLQLQP